MVNIYNEYNAARMEFQVIRVYCFSFLS